MLAQPQPLAAPAGSHLPACKSQNPIRRALRLTPAIPSRNWRSRVHENSVFAGIRSFWLARSKRPFSPGRWVAGCVFGCDGWLSGSDAVRNRGAGIRSGVLFSVALPCLPRPPPRGWVTLRPPNGNRQGGCAPRPTITRPPATKRIRSAAGHSSSLPPFVRPLPTACQTQTMRLCFVYTCLASSAWTSLISS